MTLLWLFLIVLALMVVALLARPLVWPQVATTHRGDYDIAVYRDQLTEVDKDVERKLLSPEQGEAAKTEIQRRMLAAKDAEMASASAASIGAGSLRSRLALGAFILLVIPAGAGVMYALLGSPELPGKPYAEQKDSPEAAMAAEAEQLAASLEKKPDVAGYKHLAEIYFILRRYDQAASSYQKVIGLKGESPAIWSGYGEALTMAREGLVVPEAHTAFVKALKLDRHDARARFYLGLAETQINEPRRAVAIWKDLEKDTPQDAPWAKMVKEHIAAFSKEGGFDPASIQPAPPSLKSPHDMAVKLPKEGRSAAPSDIDQGAADAVLEMKPDEQQAIIHKMVDRLAARMEQNPDDVDGWQRLAVAYRVLGETDKANEAAEKAAELQSKQP